MAVSESVLYEHERLGILTPAEKKRLKAVKARKAAKQQELDAKHAHERYVAVDKQLGAETRVSRAELSRSTANVCWADRVKAYRKKHGCTEAQAIIALMT